MKDKKKYKSITVIYSILWPGLGHIYRGRLFKGLLICLSLIFIIVLSKFILSSTFLGFTISIILLLLIYAYTIIDSLIIAFKKGLAIKFWSFYII